PCRELRPAEACRPKVRTFTRAARRRLGRLREVMRLAGLRVAINVRDFVANLPRRAPLLPALTDLLADTALAASDFLVLFLLGLVGLRAMAGLLAGPYTGRAERAIATRARTRRG